MRLPAAAHLASALAAGERPREVRRGARRALHRLKQAGIHADAASRDEPAGAVAAPVATGPAFLSSCDPDGARLLWLALDIPGSGRSAANGVVYDSGRLHSFTITRQSRAEFDQEIARTRSEMAARGAFLVTEVPVPYALHLLTSAAQAAIAQQRGVPADYAVYGRYPRRPRGATRSRRSTTICKPRRCAFAPTSSIGRRRCSTSRRCAAGICPQMS